MQAEAGGQAIDKIGPVIAVTNSAGGWRALLSALKAKTGNMKGIVAYETPGFVFPEGEGPAPQPGGFEDRVAWRSTRAPGGSPCVPSF